MAASQYSTSTSCNPLQQRLPSRNPPSISSSDSNRSNQNSTQIMDVEEIASSIREKLFQTYQLPPSSQYCSIFRVPNMLCRHNEKAFMPEVVSIGPFHHENTQLQAMEIIKLRYLKCLLYRTRTMELECMVEAIDRIEQDCRDCYAEVVDLSRKKFIEMVIDGCFILEFLYRYQQKQRGIQGEDDPVFKTSWMPRKIIADLLLLENQLPWCVLDHLFNLMPSLKTTDQRCSRLDDLVSFSFSEYKMFPAPNSSRSHEKHTHLLDCFRNCLVGSCTVKRPNRLAPSEWNPVRPVTELFRRGIPLIAKHGDNCILDVKFEEGKMKIPAIVIKENSKSVFRTLIAFEHCDPRKGYEITSYAALLHCLIKSPEDALHLNQEHILRIIGLSNEDRASFLNRLLHNNDTSFHGFLYSNLCHGVNKIYSSRWTVMKLAAIRRDIFGELQPILSFITSYYGFFISLYLSTIQTLIAVLTYFHSNSKSAK